MDMYEYFRECQENGIDPTDALNVWLREKAEYEADLIEKLEERQLCYAWQEDLIDMRRREQ